MRDWLSMTAAVALVMAAGVALPTSAQAAGGATITKDFGCSGFIPTASGGMGTSISTTESASSVVSGSGSTTLTCHFDIPAGLEPPKTTRASGFNCFVYNSSGGLVLTTDSRMQANSGGNATLSCRIRTKN